jgi:16S rRNA (guanine966-N2)-methyltransferase
MRVVAGSARGRKIVAPPGLDVRPTLDRVRQAIFNALDARGAVEGARVIDLFAGSGALGIEAISRGAEHVTFVEHDRKSLTCIKENLESLGFMEQATIVRSDVVAWSAWKVPEADLVLIDPPYTFAGWPQLLERVLPALRRPVDADPDDRGIAVLESRHPLALPATWEVVREQRYGGTVVTFAVPVLPESPTLLSSTPYPPYASSSQTSDGSGSPIAVNSDLEPDDPDTN